MGLLRAISVYGLPQGCSRDDRGLLGHFKACLFGARIFLRGSCGSPMIKPQTLDLRVQGLGVRV